MPEKVDHPPHYNLLPAVCDKCGDTIECIEVVRHMSFTTGNIVKYLWRADYKNDPLEDLKKARWYLDDAIRELARKKKEKETVEQIKNLDDTRFFDAAKSRKSLIRDES